MACVICGVQQAENGENVFKRVSECNIGEKWMDEWELARDDVVCELCIGCDDFCRENEGCRKCNLGAVSLEEFHRVQADAHAHAIQQREINKNKDDADEN